MSATGPADISFLFETVPFGTARLRNRIAMAPMTRRRSEGGVPGRDVRAYYRRRAEGGVGLIITEGCRINHPGATAYPRVPAIFGDAAMEAWARIVEDVHAAGARIIPQLWHVGAIRRPGPEIGGDIGCGPVEVIEDGRVAVRAMTEEDIAIVTAAYVEAAEGAERAGFDGIELHGAHGYLLDQFMWDGANHRTDGYGGDLAARLRFPVEVVRAIRARVSPGFPIGFRLSQWKANDYDAKLARTPEDLRIIVTALRDAGVDLLHLSTRRFWEPGFAGSPRTLSAWARALSGLPVIAVGSIGLDKIHEPLATRDLAKIDARFADLGVVAQKYAEGSFDLIAVGRGLLADPDWAAKVRAGRAGEILPVTRHAYDTLVV